jgi:hypothetical protein
LKRQTGIIAMQQKRKQVLCIDSEPSFLEQQKKKLITKELDDHLYTFNNLAEAFEFIETHVIQNNNKIHYIIIDEKVVVRQLSKSLERFWGLNNYLKKPDVIIVTEDNDAMVRNRIMQYPFVSVFIVKPVPSNYIEFLITGQTA